MHSHLRTHCHRPTPRHSPLGDRCCRADRAAAATPHLPGARPPRSAPGRPLSLPAQGRVVGTRGVSEVPVLPATSPVARSPQPATPQPRSPAALSPMREQEICLAASSAGLGLRLRGRGRGPGAARGDGDAWCLALGAHRGRRPSWGCGLDTQRMKVHALCREPLSSPSVWT